MKELYYADKNRYSNGMAFERCGRSGVLLPKVSLGFWHNFGRKQWGQVSVSLKKQWGQVSVSLKDIVYHFNRFLPLFPSSTCIC